MQTLKGKVALVTGAGRGIGRAAALALAQEGVHVGLIGLTQTHLENVQREAQALGAKAAIATADVKDLNSVTEAIERIRHELGAIDILINNAGTGKFGKFLELTPDDWEQIIRVNLMGVYNVTRAVLPELNPRVFVKSAGLWSTNP